MKKKISTNNLFSRGTIKAGKRSGRQKEIRNYRSQKDVRENTEHGITSLYTSDGFEALVELSQYINPVTDKIIDYEEEEHKILLLEKMIKSPYFARIDFKFDDEDEFEKYTLDVLLYEKTAIKRCMFMIEIADCQCFLSFYDRRSVL